MPTWRAPISSSAGLSSVAEVRVGRALDTLPGIAAENLGPFDLTFIDADEAEHPGILRLGAAPLASRQPDRGGQRVVREGAVADATSTDANVQGVRRLNQRLAGERRVSATTIQTVGIKGYDGFTLALVLHEARSDTAGA